ncbi:uncharacterized protein LOC125515648 [Triticum urartu]|uniref:uncharacterized protein LOC125515648 n=1 Tax=Triticum urartu TaxID=4572 RepID=UPI002042F4E7|nr:uncharacterized protein LOC125515648 [Triticum urartu]
MPTAPSPPPLHQPFLAHPPSRLAPAPDGRARPASGRLGSTAPPEPPLRPDLAGARPRCCSTGAAWAPPELAASPAGSRGSSPALLLHRATRARRLSGRARPGHNRPDPWELGLAAARREHTASSARTRSFCSVSVARKRR